MMPPSQWQRGNWFRLHGRLYVGLDNQSLSHWIGGSCFCNVICILYSIFVRLSTLRQIPYAMAYSPLLANWLSLCWKNNWKQFWQCQVVLLCCCANKYKYNISQWCIMCSKSEFEFCALDAILRHRDCGCNAVALRTSQACGRALCVNCSRCSDGKQFPAAHEREPGIYYSIYGLLENCQFYCTFWRGLDCFLRSYQSAGRPIRKVGIILSGGNLNLDALFDSMEMGKASLWT